MPHFYVKPENINTNTFSIEGEQAHYLFNVRRFKQNDEIMLFDGKGTSYKVKIDLINKNKISGHILSSSYKMPGPTINLYTCIPKGDRFEWLIEKCSEINVLKIIPINTKRSIITSISNKIERYEKISISASSQCGRSDVMKIENPVDFKTACINAINNKDFINILMWENENVNTLKSLVPKSKLNGANIFIGPEGGFESEEIEFAKSLNIKTLTLGGNILRIETAAVVASSLIFQFIYGII
ncbi:MAG: 16S rRNA (uracil(1498)-N(3))-methyltransferase [Endomicrobium sp.]|jgi:16S rRNA (uracil1498-N3)-methyltransferase|uniref:RsmE family RNA methyltransferase n=1 Tax=Candidatus Endomicrobiellum cubanum TaxID=3242325 RepID=UPI002819FAC2|nr:16S rRNA (uracil(1498)-N(3))-methyltransferase [Endomicrobium sp.]